MLQWLAWRLSPASADELLELNKKKEDPRPSPVEEQSLGVNLVAIACLTIFVSLGVAQAISIRFSVGGSGSLAYDASAAVTAAELAKLTFSFGWLACFNRDSIPAPTRIPTSWVWESAILLLVAVGFAIQNQVAFLAIERLGPSFFAILGNLKIVFTCIFMRIILGKMFSFLQWVAVIMLTSSAVVLKFPFLMEARSGGGIEDDDSNKLMVGLLLMLLSTASSGLTAVINEFILKRQTEGAQMPFMAKNAVLYAWGFVVNFLVWWCTGALPFFAWFHANGRFAVLCMTGMGLSCSVVLRYLDNIYRCFAACSQVFLTVLVARLILPPALQEEPFGFYHSCSLLLLATAIATYQNHESSKLGLHIGVAALGTLFICLVCKEIDSSRTFQTTSGDLFAKFADEHRRDEDLM